MKASNPDELLSKHWASPFITRSLTLFIVTNVCFSAQVVELLYIVLPLHSKEPLHHIDVLTWNLPTHHTQWHIKDKPSTDGKCGQACFVVSIDSSFLHKQTGNDLAFECECGALIYSQNGTFKHRGPHWFVQLTMQCIKHGYQESTWWLSNNMREKIDISNRAMKSWQHSCERSYATGCGENTRINT